MEPLPPDVINWIVSRFLPLQESILLSLTSHFWKKETPRHIRSISNHGWQTKHSLDWQLNLVGLSSLTSITMDTYDQYNDRLFDQTQIAMFLSKQTRLKTLVLYFMIGRSWSPSTFERALPSSLEYLRLWESKFNVDVALHVVAAAPNLRALVIEESRHQGRFGQYADMSQIAVIFTGLPRLETFVCHAIPDWTQLPPPPPNLKLFKVPDLYVRERRNSDIDSPSVFLEIALAKFAGWPKPLCMNTISRTITDGSLHVLNWLIAKGASLSSLVDVCRTHGIEPLLGNDPLISDWISCEPSIFAAVEAKRLDVVKWLIEERKVPVHPDICKYKKHSIFLFALSVSSEQICDYLLHKVAPELGVSIDYIFSNFCRDRIPVEGVDQLPPIICAASNKHLYDGGLSILDWLLSPEQREKCAVDVTQVDHTGRHALFYCRHTSVERLTQLGLDVNASSWAPKWGKSRQTTALEDVCQFYHAPKVGAEDADGLKLKRIITHPSFEPRNRDVESILRLAIFRGPLEPLELLRGIAKSEEEFVEMLSHNLPQCFSLTGSLEALRYLLNFRPQIPPLDELIQREISHMHKKAQKISGYLDDDHTKDVLQLLERSGKAHLASALPVMQQVKLS
eukprot:TRINITY_DN10353_c0_g1_i1.p1 TRINITY_DN10353_c0_g1~~TRINITY_DN10353_c0_g1_i1.p1  ORF type:complete len:623 (-),score=62.59 TRINITY_DN10353_c0_g1_i1:38-1906(-)